MRIIRSTLLALPLLFVAVGSASARIGETEQELIHRYGPVQGRNKAAKEAQGRNYIYGEYLHFRSEDWGILVLVIDSRCEEVTYSKRGEWTEAQFKHLLEVNGGRSQWEEQSTRNPQSRREWKRRDKTMATWRVGTFEIKTPVVERTREEIEKKAKEDASKLPKF